MHLNGWVQWAAYFLKMPQDMNATEFATKVMNDKNFMHEVFTHIPDAMMEEGAAEKANPDAQGQMDKMFGWYCWPFAQAKGCTFTEGELMAECDRQFKALGGFGKIKFGVRMIETLGKAKPKKR